MSEPPQNRPRPRRTDDWSHPAAWGELAAALQERDAAAARARTDAGLSQFFGPGASKFREIEGSNRSSVKSTLAGLSTFQRLGSAVKFAFNHARDPGALAKTFGGQEPQGRGGGAHAGGDTHALMADITRRMEGHMQRQQTVMNNFMQHGFGAIHQAHADVFAQARQQLGAVAGSKPPLGIKPPLGSAQSIGKKGK